MLLMPLFSLSGTELHAPPEWFTKHKYKGDPATVWSLGVLLHQLVFNERPFNTVQQIVDRSLTFEEGVSEGKKLTL